MRISSVLKIFGAGISWAALSLAAVGFASAGELTQPVGAQILPVAAFAPADVVLPEENPSPVTEVAPDIAVPEMLDPRIVLESTPQKKRAKVAYLQGKKAFKAGNLPQAFVFFEFAAAKGYLLAQWRLAKAFREGLGVQQSHAEALKWFRAVADKHDPALRRARKKLRATVSALVVLADYSRTGVKGTPFVKNLTRSQSLYRYAATRYGHPEAQYQLGIMYLNGEGLEKSQLVGMRWLMLASRKGFAKAQARLGDIYLSFKGNPKHRLTGLMWHGMAEKNAAAIREKKLLQRSGQIFATASESERELAVSMIAKMQESSETAPR